MRRACAALFFVLAFCPSLRASFAGMSWDSNIDQDLAGYRVYRATFSLLNVSTQTAKDNPNVQKKSVGMDVYISTTIPAGTTFYFRLTAYDAAGNESGFNTDIDWNDEELAFFVKIGDANEDGRVDLRDQSILQRSWKQKNPMADFNDDGIVDLVDQSLLISHWKK